MPTHRRSFCSLFRIAPVHRTARHRHVADVSTTPTTNTYRRRLNTPQLNVAERKRRRFYAVVTGCGERQLDFEPIDQRVTYHRIRVRKVIAIWRKSRAQSGRVTKLDKRPAGVGRASP
jgi:hypothetical protein